MNTCSKIRKIRLEKGYSQEYMAIQLDISQKTYGRIESGESKIDLEKLKNLSKVLEINPNELVDFSGFDIIKKPKQNEKRVKINIERECNFYKTFINQLKEENRFLRELLRKKY